ncbi:PilZ domain-containing protein [bacterium]|nr:PilZ domain-containing protein [bacterium]
MDLDIKRESLFEHRRYPRIPLNIPVHYKFLEQGDVYRALESTTRDLGAKGIAIQCDRELREKLHLILTLFLPLKGKHENTTKQLYAEENFLPIIIFSQVAWCSAKEHKQYYLGIEFLEVAPEHKKRFEAFLIKHKIESFIGPGDGAGERKRPN